MSLLNLTFSVANTVRFAAIASGIETLICRTIPDVPENGFKHAFDYAQTVTAAIIGISIVGPTTATIAAGGALLGVHAAVKYFRDQHHELQDSLHNNYVGMNASKIGSLLAMHRKKYVLCKKVDQGISFIASLVNAAGCYNVIQATGFALTSYNFTISACIGATALIKLGRFALNKAI